MATLNDGLVDSPFGRVSPEVLAILNGGSGSPAPADTQVAAPVAAPKPSLLSQARGEAPVAGQPGVVAQAAPQEPVDPNSFSSAVGRGADQAQAALGGTVEAVGELTGNQYLMDAGKQERERQLKEAEQYGKPDVESYTDVDWHDPSTVTDYLSNTVGSLTAPMAAQLGAMGAGAAAGAGVGKAFGIPGAAAGSVIGGFLASFGMNAGAMQNEIKALDPNASSPGTALLFGTGAGVLDSFGLSKIMAPMVKHLAPELIYKNAIASGIPKEMALDGLKQATMHATKSAAIEGSINSATDVTQGYLAGKVSDHEATVQSLIERGVNSFIGGAVTGGAVGSGARVLDHVMSNAYAAGTAAPTAKFADGPTTEGGFLTKVWQAGGREATAPLEPLARVAPEAEAFIRNFRPDATGEKATGKTVFEDYELRAGKWHNEEQNVFHGKDDATKAAILEEASLPKSQVKSPEALALRATLDEIQADATKAELSPGYIDGYMPFKMDAARIQENLPAFEAAISPYVQDAPAAIQNFLEQQNRPEGTNAPKVDRLVMQNPQTGQWEAMPSQTMKGDPDTLRGKFAQGSVPPKFGNLEFARAFGNVPQRVLNEWTVEQTPKQKVQAITDYIHGAAHRLAFAERFGGSGEKANKMIATAVAQAQAKGRQVSKAEVDHMYGVLDAYNGMYSRIQSDSVRNAQSAASAFLTIKSLPFAVLSSLVEITTPAIRGNIVDTIASVVPAFTAWAKTAGEVLLKGSPRSDWSQLASEAGIDLASTQNVMAERLGQNMLNRGSATVMKHFFMANGLTALTHAQRTLAAKTGERIYNDNLMKLATGIDMTSAKGAQAVRQLRTMGLEVATQGEALALVSPATPSQVKAAREAKVLAIRRFTSQTILEPNSADLPLWMQNGHLGLLAQLKRYPTAYTNIILPQLIRKMKPSYQGSYSGATAGAIGVTFILGAMIGVGFLQDWLKKVAKNGTMDYEDERTEGQRLMDVLSQTVIPMQFQYVLNMFNAPRYGSDPVTANLGPAAGLVKEAANAGYKTVASFEETPTSGYIWQFMFKQTPVINQLAPMKEEVKEFFDLP